MTKRITLVYTLALCLIFSIAYLSTQSISYDDFDSYNFGLAVTRFDLSLQQPQPPGFPLYILTAQGLNSVIQNPLSSLTILSAITGMFAVLMVFFIGITVFQSPITAFLIALIFGLMPIQWLTSVKALSDSAGLMMALLAILLLYISITPRRGMNHHAPTNHINIEEKSPLHVMGRGFRGGVIGAFALGLSLGVRPQSNYMGILVCGFAIVWMLIRHRNWRIPLYSLIFGAIGVFIWLIPTLNSVGGLEAYLALIAQHGEHVSTSDSLFSAGMTLMSRVNDLLETFLLPTFGVSVYRPFGLADWLILLACVMVLVIGIVCADYRKPSTWFIVIWALVMFAPYFLFTSLNRPRLMLPCIPPLLLWIGLGWERILRMTPVLRGIGIVGASGLALFFAIQSIPLATIISTTPAPHDQARDYIREFYPPDQTAIAVAGSYRTVQTELADYRAIFYRYQFDPATVQTQIRAQNYAYIAIVDRDGFGDVMPALDDDGRYVPIDDVQFYRDERVHWEHHQTRLQILMPLDQLTADRLTLPDDGEINIAQDGKFLGLGWFRSEDVGGVMARWGGDSLISQVRVSLIPKDYQVEFFATPFSENRMVTVMVNGVMVAELALSGGWNVYQFDLPADVIPDGDIMLLEFVHDTMLSPYEQTDGASSDRRALTVAYAWIKFSSR
ncbi:MAG: hypothetical protein KJ043_01365 [Anaerolineae bacterium]|nr:hypothetical protein [Anaerolineae bacterium]